MEYKIVDSLEHYNKLTEEKDAVLMYHSHDDCNVCKVMKPKIIEIVKKHFPKLELYYANTREVPEVSGQNRIFAVPTITVHFAGREYIRMSRNIGMVELHNKIARPYSMMFEE